MPITKVRYREYEDFRASIIGSDANVGRELVWDAAGILNRVMVVSYCPSGYEQVPFTHDFLLEVRGIIEHELHVPRELVNYSYIVKDAGYVKANRALQVETAKYWKKISMREILDFVTPSAVILVGMHTFRDVTGVRAKLDEAVDTRYCFKQYPRTSFFMVPEPDDVEGEYDVPTLQRRLDAVFGVRTNFFKQQKVISYHAQG